MEYEKITFLPTDDKETAYCILNDMLYHQGFYMVFVLGRSSDSMKLTEYASSLVKNTTWPAMVCVIRQPEVVSNLLQNLLKSYDNRIDFREVIMFSTKITDIVADVVFKSEPKLDLLRVFECINKAYVN